MSFFFPDSRLRLYRVDKTVRLWSVRSVVSWFRTLEGERDPALVAKTCCLILILISNSNLFVLYTDVVTLVPGTRYLVPGKVYESRNISKQLKKIIDPKRKRL